MEGGEEGEEGGAGARHRVAVQGAARHGQPGGKEVAFCDPRYKTEDEYNTLLCRRAVSWSGFLVDFLSPDS